MEQCRRCGACCLMGPCSFGEEDPITGICALLQFDGDIAICPKIKPGNEEIIKLVKPGTGCRLRSDETDGSITKYLEEIINIHRGCSSVGRAVD